MGAFLLHRVCWWRLPSGDSSVSQETLSPSLLPRVGGGRPSIPIWSNNPTNSRRPPCPSGLPCTAFDTPSQNHPLTHTLSAHRDICIYFYTIRVYYNSRNYLDSISRSTEQRTRSSWPRTIGLSMAHPSMTFSRTAISLYVHLSHNRPGQERCIHL